tara:strand:+ start:690 stop:1670 length:981 start_codon:yes stop_codon:yes gene_type:complete
MPRVPGLLLCAKDELWAPEMDLAEITTFTRVKLKNDEGQLGYTASYFLGEVLAKTNCTVRLTNGAVKSLQSLRENERINLSASDCANVIDDHMLSGAVRANATNRLLECASTPQDKILLLNHLELNDKRIRDLSPLLNIVLKDTILKLDLSWNPFGTIGLLSIFFPVDCGFRQRRVIQSLSLQHVALENDGVNIIARAFEEDVLLVGDLDLSFVKMGSQGLRNLSKSIRMVANRQQQSNVCVLTRLNLSENHAGKKREDFDELLKPGTFPYLKDLDLLYSGVTNNELMRLARAIEIGHFPSICKVIIPESRVSDRMKRAVCAATRA